MPDNCDLCEKLSAGAFGLTNTYQDIFTWLVRWNHIFMDGSILKSERWNNLKLLIFQESRLRVHQAKLGSGGVQEDLAEEGEVLKLIWQRKEGEVKWEKKAGNSWNCKGSLGFSAWERREKRNLTQGDPWWSITNGQWTMTQNEMRSLHVISKENYQIKSLVVL